MNKKISVDNLLNLGIIESIGGIIQDDGSEVESFIVNADPLTKPEAETVVTIFELQQIINLINDKSFAETFDVSFTPQTFINADEIKSIMEQWNRYSEAINHLIGDKKIFYLYKKLRPIDWINQMRKKLHNLPPLSQLPRPTQELDRLINKTSQDIDNAIITDNMADLNFSESQPENISADRIKNIIKKRRLNLVKSNIDRI